MNARSSRVVRRLAAALVFIIVALAAPSLGQAGTRRVAVVVGHNTGADTQVPLRFAEEDAGKLADVLVDLGDVAPADLFLVQGKGTSVVREVLGKASAAVARARATPDDRVILLFFYSGHSDGQSIELGRERLAYRDLRAWLSSTNADVRIAIVDSCKSGALTQKKGGAAGPAFDISLVDELATNGEVFLTSAAADEDALESSEIRGSFFTHHFVSGLRGAADSSGDGTVTLAEAYEYAFNHTVTSTAQAGAAQHPTYDYRVAGRGELTLTEVSRRSAVLELPAEFQRALVVQPRRDQVIAELTSATTRRVAVAPGEYGVRLWRGGHQSAGRVRVGAGQVLTITWEQLTAIDAPPPERTKGGHTEEPTLVEAALPPDKQGEWDRLWVSVDDRDRIYVGKVQRRLGQRDAFQLMNRKDMVARYDRKSSAKNWMIWGGVGMVVGTILIDRLVIRDCANQIINQQNGDCVSNADTVNTVAGFAVLGGIALSIVGLTRDTDAASGAELRTVVSNHNQALRSRLMGDAPGATPAASPASPTAAPTGTPAPHARADAPTLRLSAWVRPGEKSGGGLMLFGTF
jgi:Caspase domain